MNTSRVTHVLSRGSCFAIAISIAAACSGDPASIQTSNTDGGASTPTSDASFEGDASSANDAAPSADGNAKEGVDASSSSTNDYSQDGSHIVTTKNENVTVGADTFTVVTYLPSGAGPFPVVVLSSGLEQTAAGYAPYAKRLASWGIAAILRDDPGIAASSPTIQADVEGLVENWLPTADSNAFDATRVGLAGHSRGGQVSLLAAENGLLGKNRGLFLLDPVNSQTASVMTKIASLAVPLAMIGETTDSGTNDCAPATDNYASIYAGAASPALAITAVNAGHVMFEDPANCTFCTLCTPGSADSATVLATSVQLMTTFFGKVLLGDTSIDATLDTTALVTAGIVTVVSK